MISVKPTAPFTRTELAKFLDLSAIGNRMLFGGNLIKQPAFVQLKNDNPDAFRVVTNTTQADNIMNRVLFIGTFPGLTIPMLDYISKKISEFVSKQTR